MNGDSGSDDEGMPELVDAEYDSDESSSSKESYHASRATTASSAKQSAEEQRQKQQACVPFMFDDANPRSSWPDTALQALDLGDRIRQMYDKAAGANSKVSVYNRRQGTALAHRHSMPSPCSMTDAGFLVFRQRLPIRFGLVCRKSALE